MALKIRKDGAWVKINSKTNGSVTATVSGSISAGDPVIVNSDGTVSAAGVTPVTPEQEHVYPGPSAPYTGFNTQTETHEIIVGDKFSSPVTHVQFLCIGGGGGGGSNRDDGAGGGGGVSYATVSLTTLGTEFEIGVGAGGEGGDAEYDGEGGGDSYVKKSGSNLAFAEGGEAGTMSSGEGGTYNSGDGGGKGGNGGLRYNTGYYSTFTSFGTGGGGAGSAAGQGNGGNLSGGKGGGVDGSGGVSDTTGNPGEDAVSDSGGGGGGGASLYGPHDPYTNSAGGGGGGGVNWTGSGPFGRGEDGEGGAVGSEGGKGGKGGSGGGDGEDGYDSNASGDLQYRGGDGGEYGGGGGKAGVWDAAFTWGGTIGGDGARGAVRMLGCITNLQETNFLGFSESNYTNNDTATINIVGSINTHQSGLTPAQIYYVHRDGKISTTADTIVVKAGVALNSTTLLIKD